MRRALSLAATTLALLAGCADGQGVVVLTLQTAETIPPYTEIDVDVMNASGDHRVIYPLAARSSAGPIHETLSLTFPPSMKGPATVQVTAYDGTNPVAAESMPAAITLAPSQVTQITVALTALGSTEATCAATFNCLNSCNGDATCAQACRAKTSPDLSDSADKLNQCDASAKSGMCATACSDPSSAACSSCLYGTCTGSAPTMACDASSPCGAAANSCLNK